VPDPVALDNYPLAFELVDIPRYTLNSLLVVAAAVPLTLLFASWTGFAMTRLSRRAAGPPAAGPPGCWWRCRWSP